jgi:hypothetical protein
MLCPACNVEEEKEKEKEKGQELLVRVCCPRGFVCFVESN